MDALRRTKKARRVREVHRVSICLGDTREFSETSLVVVAGHTFPVGDTPREVEGRSDDRTIERRPRPIEGSFAKPGPQRTVHS
jgi:hypothetical protein